MIKKVVNGEAKAVSRICKRSYNLFNADVFSSALSSAISYDRKAQTVTVTNSYATSTGHTLDQFAPSLKAGSTYVLSFETTAANHFIWVVYPGGKGYPWTAGTARILTENDLKSRIHIYGEVGKTHTLSKFQIVEGAETKPYLPYLLDVNKAKKVIDVTDQMTNSKGNYYWNAENQEWTGAHMEQKEYCHVGNAKPIFEKHGLQRYVVEFDGRSEVAGRINFYSLSGGNYGYTIPYAPLQFTTDWQHYKIGFIPTILNNSTEGNCTLSFFGDYGSGRVPHIKNFKIRTSVDVFTHVTSEVADGVVEVGPAKVSDGVLEIKGDNVKVENNKLIIK